MWLRLGQTGRRPDGVSGMRNGKGLADGSGPVARWLDPKRVQEWDQPPKHRPLGRGDGG